jgi:hypothetical protein
MVCYEDIHITNENRNFKISILFLLLFHHTILNNSGRKFNGHQKYILYPKENYHNNGKVLKGEPLGGDYLRNLIFFL